MVSIHTLTKFKLVWGFKVNTEIIKNKNIMPTFPSLSVLLIVGVLPAVNVFSGEAGAPVWTVTIFPLESPSTGTKMLGEFNEEVVQANGTFARLIFTAVI